DRALVHGVGVGGDDVDAGRAGCVLRAEAAEHHTAAFRPEEFGVCDASLIPVDRQGFGETQNFCQETQSCPCVLIAQARPHTGRRRIACFMFLAHVWESSRVWPRRIEEMGARGGSIPPECCLPTPATPGSDAAGRRIHKKRPSTPGHVLRGVAPSRCGRNGRAARPASWSGRTRTENARSDVFGSTPPGEPV